MQQIVYERQQGPVSLSAHCVSLLQLLGQQKQNKTNQNKKTKT